MKTEEPDIEASMSEEDRWKEGSQLLNLQSDPMVHQASKSFSVTHQASESFVDLIQKARQDGYGFVPFVGAGFSAPSGAPLVWELKSYLQRCIFLALQKPSERRWHPRTAQWPPFIDRDRPQDGPVSWSNEIFKQLMESWQQHDKSPGLEEELAVLAEGYGAAAEWRTSLLFLSRLTHGQRGAASLEAHKQEIIDSCLRKVLTDKDPALNHNMLAVLAGALRLDLVLTTNFDDLLERAFAAARNPLEVFEVHLGDSLPHWSAVSEVRSLVKLHGNRYSLRADYSLDALPSEQDKLRFLEYLLSARGRYAWANKPEEPGLDFQNHLLVMGVSGNDFRTLALIEYAWQHLNDKFRVFWLCYSDRDVEDILKLTKKFFDGPGQKRWKGSIILRHTNFGLLLLQLYQAIRRNLPPFGGLFPSVSRLTLPPLQSIYVPPKLDPTPASSTTVGSFHKKVLGRLKDFQEPECRARKLIVATSYDMVRGMTSACSKIFCQMETNCVCLWLDMNDISSADNLFEVLLEAAYFRLGLEHWVPVYRETETGKRAREIKRLVRSVDKPWVIFLNARETPGANTAEALDVLNSDHPHGWLDDLEESLRPDGLSDRSNCTERFLELLEHLCGRHSPHISVVLMCRDGTPEPALIRELKKENLLENHIQLEKIMPEAFGFPEKEIVAAAIEWTENDKHKQRFLHALVLMQRPRLLATIWSDAVSLERQESPDIVDQRQTWLNDLEKRGLLRRKAGGFIWMHLRCRQHIREVLWDPAKLAKGVANYAAARTALNGWTAKADEAEIHTELAGWYQKVLDASEAPAAAFEVVYHLCRAAEAFWEQNAQGQCLWKACARLDAATALLKTNSFLIQTHGYARGSCRRLEDIRTLCKRLEKRKELGTAARRLRIACTEVMRAIAREVGEDAKAYLRHRQFGMLRALRPGEELIQELGDSRNPGEQDISRKLFAGLLGGDGANDEITAASEWVRWWRWSGMLAIGSRSYDIAESALKKALQCAERPREYPDPVPVVEPNRSGLQHVARSELRLHESQSQELRVEELRVLEQFVELLLLKYGVERRLIGLNVTDQSNLSESALQRLKEIEIYIVRGRTLASEIRGMDHSSDSHNTISANWCECRLLIHQSICISRRFQLIPQRKPTTLNRAMGLLGDAEASLRVSDPRRHRSELAMVELHRADARLRAAEAVEVYESQDTSLCFAEMCRHLEKIKLEPGWRGRLGQMLREFLDQGMMGASRVHDPLRRAKSLVADGIRFLNRVEPVLRERRRNVWWTTWFFERQLRLIAMSVWASVFETGTPIPFFGLEAATAGTSSVADELLEDAIRMISVDAYRLATIVDAYASCAKALQFRLMLDAKSIRLDSRQQEMRENLRNARDELNNVEYRRENTASAVWDKRNKMSSTVKDYIHAVSERSGLIYTELEPGI